MNQRIFARVLVWLNAVAAVYEHIWEHNTLEAIYYLLFAVCVLLWERNHV